MTVNERLDKLVGEMAYFLCGDAKPCEKHTKQAKILTKMATDAISEVLDPK